jgi:hypothetical protein
LPHRAAFARYRQDFPPSPGKTALKPADHAGEPSAGLNVSESPFMQ